MASYEVIEREIRAKEKLIEQQNIESLRTASAEIVVMLKKAAIEKEKRDK